MGKYDDKKIVACPQCKCALFSVDLSRHFLKVHSRELSAKELVGMLDRSNLPPVNARKAAAFLERLHALDEKQELKRRPFRTPASMQQWMRTGQWAAWARLRSCMSH